MNERRLEYRLGKVLHWNPLRKKQAIVQINKLRTLNFKLKKTPNQITIYFVNIKNQDGLEYSHYLACSEYKKNGRFREHKEQYDHFPERKELKKDFSSNLF